MPVFICAKCGCIDNTATSSYWSMQVGMLDPDLKYDKSLIGYKGRPLCSECGKLAFYQKPDGEIAECIVPGRWHNRFEKRAATDDERAMADKVSGIIRYRN